MTPPLIYAHFHQRALAWILDVFLLAALLAPFVYLLNTFAATHLTAETSLILYRIVRLGLVLGVSLTILSGCTARFGGTPGKILLGLQVIDFATHKWLTPRQALLRILLTIPVTFSVLGVLMMFFNSQRQAFHDKAMHTLVIVKEHDYAEEPLPGDLL